MNNFNLLFSIRSQYARIYKLTKNKVIIKLKNQYNTTNM